MAMKYWIIIILGAYILIWLLTSYALGHDEKDEKMKSLWFMASMFWPFVWFICIIGWISWLFTKDERDLR